MKFDKWRKSACELLFTSSKTNICIGVGCVSLCNSYYFAQRTRRAIKSKDFAPGFMLA
jgi:hypothetical protein